MTKRKIRGSIQTFLRAEEGSITVLTLFLIIAMIFTMGVAVDLMRFENHRARYQSTVDRAVLSAVRANVCLSDATDITSEEVVESHLGASGYGDLASSVTVRRSSDGVCEVDLDSSLAVNNIFTPILDIEDFAGPIQTAAISGVNMTEVSLVLDISGSMRNGTRMDDLRPAAQDFVSTVLNATQRGTTSINLIPYAGQTNPGPEMFDYLDGVRFDDTVVDGVDVEWTYDDAGACIDFPTSDFQSDRLPSIESQQTPYFMNWPIAADVMEWGWCPSDDTAIVYASESEADLNQMIATMPMHDGTGTHYAMKWALALLNPTTQAAFNHLISAGEIDPTFAGRPAAFSDRGTVKFIVLMTDGNITDQFRPADPYDALNGVRALRNQSSGARETITSASDNVQSFYDACDLARDQGVIVFTIAFEAPAGAVEEMSNCATSPAHFFIADGSNIDSIFQSIAGSILPIRLTN